MNLIKNIKTTYKYQDKIIFWSLFFSFTMSFLILLFWLSIYFLLPTQIPLFYSLPWGEPQLANKIQYLILPAVLFISILTNLIISWQIHPSQIFIKKVLAATSSLISLLFTITAFKIIFIFL